MDTIVELAKQIEDTTDPELKEKLKKVLDARIKAEEENRRYHSFDGIDPNFFTIH